MKRTLIIAVLAGCVALLAFVIGVDAGDQSTQAVAAKDSKPTSTSEKNMNNPNYEKAMFGAGCFWGVEATFRQIKGVKETAVGFAGGNVDNPSYKDVCYDNTGHAEVVQVVYDPAVVTYSDLLKVFWENHDPTQFNRQGPDYGNQYRSVIFCYGDEQTADATASKKSLEESGKFKRPIVTQIVSAPTFWKAEEYHQQYLEKRGLSTCGIK